MACFSKTIGIVGGAGPMASAFLYSSILEFCQKNYNADDYSDFPEIVLISYPFSRGDEDSIKKEIRLCLSKLKNAGASLFCIASNSFHGFLPAAMPAGFVNLVKEGLEEAGRRNISKALILAAPTTIRLKLYEKSNISCVYPSFTEQEQVNKLIREIASGKVEKSQAIEISKIIARIHKEHSLDGVIIGCTELPLLHQIQSFSDCLPIVNTVEVLAEKLVKLARNNLFQ